MLMHDGHKQAEELTMEHSSARAFYLEIMLHFLLICSPRILYLNMGQNQW